MAPVTIEQIMQMAEQLSPSDQLVLVEELQVRFGYHPERSRLLAEFIHRKATKAFNNLESLYGKFADPPIEVSEEALF